MTLCIPCASVDYCWFVVFLQNFHKPRRMLTHLDWSSLTAPGPYLMPTGLFCCPVSTAPLRLPSPTAFCGSLLPTPLWLAFPCTLPVASRSQAQAFVWFRAKTNKKIVCLAHPLHSVRNQIYRIISNLNAIHYSCTTYQAIFTLFADFKQLPCIE